MRIRRSRTTDAAKQSSSRRRAPRRGGAEMCRRLVCRPRRRGRSIERRLHRREGLGWPSVRESTNASLRDKTKQRMEALTPCSVSTRGRQPSPRGDALLRRDLVLMTLSRRLDLVLMTLSRQIVSRPSSRTRRHLGFMCIRASPNVITASFLSL